MLTKLDVQNILTVEQWARFKVNALSYKLSVIEDCYPEEEVQRFLNQEIKPEVTHGHSSSPSEVRPS